MGRLISALLTGIVLLSPLRPLHADAFDYYTNSVLKLVPKAKGVLTPKTITTELLLEHNQVLPNLTGAFLVVQTNEGRFAKLLVQPAFRKKGEAGRIPILLIDRFVTYRISEEMQRQAAGQNVNLFSGFRFSLDIGQVVPEAMPADLRFYVKDDKHVVEPVGKAKFYLLTKPMPEAEPKAAARLEIGATFLPQYFTGVYRFNEDGRRTGKLELTVDNQGIAKGRFISDLDGAEYEVTGRVGKEKHAIQLTIKFPRTELLLDGMMFTGNGKAIAGSAQMLSRKTAFYAIRIEGE
ncbi:MAG: hypothetical protein KatS3mg105_0294 [Gemmatales bacterium]|nr:MAG: hypothetical protein KatS3mg105_0294 [Gemmatales bacterium]